jgi:hypothetical protein
MDSEGHEEVAPPTPEDLKRPLERFSPANKPENNLFKRFGYGPERFDSLERDIRTLTDNPHLHIIRPSRRHWTIEHNARGIVALSEAVVGDGKFEPLSAQEASEYSGAASLLLNISGLFGERVKGKAQSFVERKATETVRKKTEDVRQFIDLLEDTPRPRQEFLNELNNFYEDAGQSRWFLSRHLYILLGELRWLSTDKGYKNKELSERYPLLVSFWVLAKPKTDNLRRTLSNDDKLSIMEPEIMATVGGFLKEKGKDVDLDLAKSRSRHIYRGIAERLKPRELEAGKRKIEREVPPLLQDIYEILPEDGPSFALAVKKQFEEIARMKHEGRSPTEIVKQVGLL